MPLEAKADRAAIERLIAGLRVAHTPAYLGEKLSIQDIQRMVLAKLKDDYFPAAEKQDPNREYSGHLRSGWRAFTFSDGNRIGFELKNTKAAENPRVQTILASLDKGSKGYIREVGDKRSLSFKGIPGRATRPNESYAPFIFTSLHIFIPARRPVNYVEKTYRYADDLLALKFPDYVRGLRQDMRRWANRD